MDSSAILQIIIQAKDEATAKIQAMKTTMLETGAAFLAAGTAITGALGYAIKQAADAQVGINQLNAVIKSTGGVAGVTANQAIELADSLQNLTTYSNDTVLGAENMLLTFTNIKSNIFPQTTQAVLDMAQAFKSSGKSMDLSQIAIQVGKALNDPVQGINALTRVGVTFTQEQKDQVKAMVEAGNAIGAQKMILAELNREFGGSAAAAADTFEGKILQLKNTFDDFAKVIGNILLPILTDLLKKVEPIVSGMLNWTKAHPELTRQLTIVAAVVGVLFVGIGTLLAVVIPLTIAFGAMTLPIVGVVAAVGLLAAGITLLILNWGKVKDVFKNAWEEIEIIFQTSIDKIMKWLQPLINAVNMVSSGIGKAAGAVGGAVNSGLKMIGLASGGIVTQPTFAMIGESGPEAVIPLSGGGAAGFGGVTINIGNLYGTDQNAARNFGNQIARMINQNLKLKSI